MVPSGGAGCAPPMMSGVGSGAVPRCCPAGSEHECPGGFILLLICFWQDSEMMEEKFPPGEPIDIASQPVV